jgi:hypothetical protein
MSEQRLWWTWISGRLRLSVVVNARPLKNFVANSPLARFPKMRPTLAFTGLVAMGALSVSLIFRMVIG